MTPIQHYAAVCSRVSQISPLRLYPPIQVRVADKAKKAAREEKWAKEAAEREDTHIREDGEAKKNKKKGKKGEKAEGNVGAIGGASKSETKSQRSRRIEQERSAKKESQRAEEGASIDELQALCAAQNMHQVPTAQRELAVGATSAMLSLAFTPFESILTAESSQP
jgi:hypothetical protein